MPDWITHILFALVIFEIFGFKKKSLIVLGSIVPDFIVKVNLLSLIFDFPKGMVYKFTVPFHTPMGVILISILIGFIFQGKDSLRMLLIGGFSHLLLDLTNKSMLYGENMLLFPFSWHNFGLELFRPDKYFYFFPIMLASYILILAIKQNIFKMPRINQRK